MIDNIIFIVYNTFIEMVKVGKIMKYRYTEQQLVSLSMAKFEETVSQLPFVKNVKVTDCDAHDDVGDFVATVIFTDSKIEQKFTVFVKTKGEPRFAVDFMQKSGPFNKRNYSVFMAPYISEQTSKLLREGSCSYMDLCGNCCIYAKHMYVLISGNPNIYINEISQTRYFSKSSSAVSTVLRTMLNEPDRLWKVKELSDVSGKSMGTVSNVKTFLFEKDFICIHDSMFRLKNIRGLLYDWSREYHKKATIERQFYSLDTIPMIEAKISEWSLEHKNDAVLSGFSAAARYAPTVRYNKVNVYVKEQRINEFIRTLDLEPVQSGGNVVITIPHDETPWMFVNIINNSVVASPVQTIIDLLGMPNRGEEAANAIIFNRFGTEVNVNGKENGVSAPRLKA